MNLSVFKIALTKPEIELAYVFGSFAKGAYNDLSDIDVAVKYKQNIVKIDSVIIAELEKIFPNRRIDFVDIDTAFSNPVLLASIVFDGVCLHIADFQSKLRLESHALHLYNDTAFLRDVSYKIMHRQIQDAAAGKDKK